MFIWSGFPANFTIPSIYDETMDYEKQLGKVLYCLRQLKKYVETLPEELGKYVDSEISGVMKWAESNILNPLTSMIKDLESTVDSNLSLTEKEIKDLKDIIDELDMKKASIVYVDSEIVQTKEMLKKYTDGEVVKLNIKIEDAINNLMKYSDNNLYTAKRYADSLLVVAKAYADSIKTELLEVISDAEKSAKKYSVIQVTKEKAERMLEDLKLKDSIDNLSDKSFPVYNIPRGKKTSVQQAITDLYVGLRPFALTNRHMAEADISYEDIIKLGLSCFEWEVYGGHIIKHKATKVFSPVSGKRMSLYDCLCELVDVLRWNGKTVDWWTEHVVPPDEAEKDGVSISDWTFTRKILTSDIGERINLLLTTSQTLWINDTLDTSTIEINLPKEELSELEIVYTGLEGGYESKIIAVDKGTGLFVIQGDLSSYNAETKKGTIRKYENYIMYDKNNDTITFTGTTCYVVNEDAVWDVEKVDDMFVPVKIINRVKHDSIITLGDGFIDY